MKFSTIEGVGEVRGDQVVARRCYNTSLKKCPESALLMIGSLADERKMQLRKEPAEPLIDIPIAEGKVVEIGSQLAPGIKEALVRFLQQNLEVFAWSPEDMPGIDPKDIVHHLNIDPKVKPVKQKRRKFAPDRNMAIAEEVGKLLKAQFIEEAHYPDWLSNVVMVKKSSGKWRMCVDFTDLNKACPKDSFPLPHISSLVDATAGYELLSFMDAFSGYNQIFMHPSDQEKTAFITDRGLYCYKVMPFDLKNAGATYQRLVNRMFQEQIGKNMEVYVDDVLVKSKLQMDHVTDLQEVFKTLERFKMKLNPTKCAFGVSSGKFLGYMVSSRGIEANPEKIQAVLDMQSLKNVKQVQQLTGRIAALNRFISRSTDKCLPFFKILRKAFEWSEECEQAFEQLKRYLISPPLLSRAVPGEILYLYLAVSPTAVSAALIREEEGVQKPVYFISRALHGAEERYVQMEKLAFALVIASRKLRPYFQAHTINVLTKYSLKKVLRKLDLSGRLVNWAIEISEFDIHFVPRNAIKGQALADFVVEFTNIQDQEDWPKESTWVIYVDGSSAKRNGGAGVVIITPDGRELKSSLRLEFKTTNNEAEYEAVIAGLGLAQELEAELVEVRSDSQVIVGHIRGEFEAKGTNMKLYLSKIQGMLKSFKKFCIVKIPREENEKADHLARLGSSTESEVGESEQIIQVQQQPSIAEKVFILTIEVVPAWAEEIVGFLQRGILSGERRKAVRLKQKAARFTLVNGALFKRGFMLLLLKCVSKEEGNYVLREIHEGVCGSHSGPRILAHKAVRAGFFCPSMNQDSINIVKTCNSCQRFANAIKQPPEELSSVSSPWPFSQWGVDIVGPLPTGKGGVRFVVVAVDYFTKWAEAEALVNITAKNIEKFLWRSVICRYGIPHAFVTDNGKQFDCECFRSWCAGLHVRQYFSSPGHPQANGQVEATNKTIFKILKKKLGQHKGEWSENLPEVLWAYRTTRRTPTEETPFALAYGTEAVIPAEVGSGSFRVDTFNPNFNDEGLKLHLDLLQEKQDQAQVTMAAYQQRVARYFNRRVKHRSFKVRDLVLKKVTLATKDATEGKLAPNWEGPYQVIKCGKARAYHLANSEGKQLQRPWNAEHLKKYFV
ncbi:uncharacterized protein LOC132162267 [Corylus avellana]|uniref:uncharacterized protein LOC132162267 n=1 Tax=Corylus avellana TaxID=13451 RepID=UPI00286BFF47|nr:uncharacterized protein LOC132162267 [Corylus avellana]